MSLGGLDEEVEVKTEENEPKDSKVKKKPFAYWNVGDKEYRLKLKGTSICNLEEKYKSNLLTILTGKDVPPLSVMLTVIQAAAKDWNHNLRFVDLQNAFDAYVDEGGTQLTLFADVILPLMAVSGFFTKTQTEDMARKMEDAKELM
ncbi:DUF6096 family protein [Murimonas intestini]|uniref:DUF6096 family protein n=1 Tax=Murimonas intestini TaxID=1337051 RepID=UPI00248CE910|nr:DUF6096 family protein [Murimonas intestini]